MMTNSLGYIYSKIKTVHKEHYEEYYGINSFYMAMGYKELECFKTLWDEWNLCIYAIYNDASISIGRCEGIG